MYDTMHVADSAALMVTQGWFLSAVPRMPWGIDQARAFLHGPPQGKLLVLDLNAIENPVWNRTESFYGVPFAFCMLHNFGERPGLFGRLPLLAAAPVTALRKSVPGTDVGLGMTPEGTGTNPIVYDLFSEMFWNGFTTPDVTSWVTLYYRRRYGLPLAAGDGAPATLATPPGAPSGTAAARASCDAHAGAAWALLQASVYSAPAMIAGEQGATVSYAPQRHGCTHTHAVVQTAPVVCLPCASATLCI